MLMLMCSFFFSSRRRHTRCSRDWSSDVCSSDCGQIGFHDDVGKAAFPVTEFEVGQHDFANVPAEEHITLPEALFQRVQEVGGGDPFATIDPFDVGGADLDVLDLALFNQAFDVCKLHSMSSSFLI